MARLPRSFNWGDKLKNENRDLYEQLNKVYTDIVNVLNTKTGRYVTDVDPVASSQFNANFAIGDFWMNSDTATPANSTLWVMVARTTLNDVTWREVQFV